MILDEQTIPARSPAAAISSQIRRDALKLLETELLGRKRELDTREMELDSKEGSLGIKETKLLVLSKNLAVLEENLLKGEKRLQNWEKRLRGLKKTLNGSGQLATLKYLTWDALRVSKKVRDIFGIADKSPLYVLFLGFQTLFRRLAMELHPDRNGNEEKFKDLQNAFESIKDRCLRKLI